MSFLQTLGFHSYLTSICYFLVLESKGSESEFSELFTPPYNFSLLSFKLLFTKERLKPSLITLHCPVLIRRHVSPFLYVSLKLPCNNVFFMATKVPLVPPGWWTVILLNFPNYFMEVLPHQMFLSADPSAVVPEMKLLKLLHWKGLKWLLRDLPDFPHQTDY